MRVLLLFTPGRECPRSLPQFKKLGYEVELMDTRVSHACLTNDIDTRITWGLTDLKEDYARPLRAAWVTMLNRFKDADKYTLFCEADAYPLVSADRVKDWIDAAPKDADVVRWAFHHAFRLYKDILKDKDSFETREIVYERMPREIESTLVWGTHALWVAPGKREKLARFYAGLPLPVDSALGWMSWSGDLHIYNTKSCTLFIQHPYGEQNSEEPIPLALCLWVPAEIEDKRRIVKRILSIMPATSILCITTPDAQELKAICKEEAGEKKWIVQKKNIEWEPGTPLKALLPKKLNQSDYPVACVLSSTTEYPDSYFDEIALRYRTVDYDTASFGLRSTEDGAAFYRGTLVCATSQLSELKYADCHKLRSYLTYYNCSSWNDEFIGNSTAPPNCIVPTAKWVTLGDSRARLYNDSVFRTDPCEWGSIVRRTADKLVVYWNDSQKEIAYDIVVN